ncbi:MAG: lipoprotein-releasing system ATP-binding protein LolD [Crocinitomicaceae bacterium]|jgi:lipoprotein-releasing system ATP-binding protein|nr:lipoprotein-releasing system ATP-binding protein LolD [Crocinitomicaceae bacterium]
MIQARGITKQFDSFDVLKGIDLDIPKSQITSIVGASGAGKTTLLQILGTLNTPDSGTLRIDNQDVHALNRKQLAAFRNQHIGFIFQFHRLLPEFTALENVLMPAWIAGRNDKEAKSYATQLLVELGLQDHLQKSPSTLSGGEQQRVAAARALMNQPSVVLADEPTGNLDSDNAESLFDLFVELRDRVKQTFIVVTHNEKLAERGDHVVKLSDGKLI